MTSPQNQIAASILNVVSKTAAPNPNINKEEQMANSENLPAVQNNNDLPEYLQLYLADQKAPLATGLEEARQFTTAQYIKIVQSSSTDLLKERSIGDMILTPDDDLIAPVILDTEGKPTTESQRIPFTPISFFVEWIIRNPLNVEPFVRERSRDPSSEIASRARSFDKSINTLPYPEEPDNREKSIRYCETLNYISFLHLEGFNSVPVIVSFSVGSYKNGSAFGALAGLRKAPMYCCIFELYSKYTVAKKGDYYSLTADNPRQGPSYVEQGDLQRNTDLFKGYLETNKLIRDQEIGNGAPVITDNVIEAANTLLTPESPARTAPVHIPAPVHVPAPAPVPTRQSDHIPF